MKQVLTYAAILDEEVPESCGKSCDREGCTNNDGLRKCSRSLILNLSLVFSCLICLLFRCLICTCYSGAWSHFTAASLAPMLIGQTIARHAPRLSFRITASPLKSFQTRLIFQKCENLWNPKPTWLIAQLN